MLGKLLSGGTADLIKNVGGVINNLHTSKEEKLEAERKIKDMIMGYEAEMQKQNRNKLHLKANLQISREL